MKTLDQEKVLKILETHKDTITEIHKQTQKYIRTSTCPVCSNFDNDPELDMDSNGNIRINVDGFPKYLSKCKTCKTVFEPNMRLVYSLA